MFKMLDSMSDGMCGYVEVTDTDTGHSVNVRWDVYGDIDSQSAAYDEAVRRLTVMKNPDNQEVEVYNADTGLYDDETDMVLEDPYFDYHTFSGLY